MRRLESIEKEGLSLQEEDAADIIAAFNEVSSTADESFHLNSPDSECFTSTNYTVH